MGGRDNHKMALIAAALMVVFRVIRTDLSLYPLTEKVVAVVVIYVTAYVVARTVYAFVDLLVGRPRK